MALALICLALSAVIFEIARTMRRVRAGGVQGMPNCGITDASS